MKLNPFVSLHTLYDIAGTPGVATNVSHINTRSQVVGYMGEDQLGQAVGEKSRFGDYPCRCSKKARHDS